MNFDDAFKHLTGNTPFPWQESLYQRFISDRHDNIPSSCSLPTGLGKTSVVALWLIALAQHPNKVPRRLVYVVNRRTVVDQTTNEVEKYRTALQADPELMMLRQQLTDLWELPLDDKETKRTNQKNQKPISPLALSTLRGQFADNREWSTNPARPAVIVGTVDMIGSRLLFCGYGIGFKAKPLHAGFLGQDVLLVHDEAHLEPAFQDLVVAIETEQRDNEPTVSWPKMRVMELTATSRGSGEVFKLTDADESNSVVDRRINARKSLVFHEVDDEKKQLTDKIFMLCNAHKESGKAILIYVRSVENLNTVVAGLRKAKYEDQVQQLTGTLRGLERNNMADPRNSSACPIFARFLSPPKDDAPETERWKIAPKPGTVFLVCTSAGEVGVNISADHLVCDLTPFDSMAQRFGRVNRFGDCTDTRIDVVTPTKFDDKEYAIRQQRTLTLLHSLNGNGSPAALGRLDSDARVEAFSPPSVILPVTDILFDAWALTTIRDKLPGRPKVEPYLHGLSGWEPPQSKVAWREEVSILNRVLETARDRNQFHRYATELMESYPLKNHELLSDRTDRVFNTLKKLAAPPETPVWLVDDEDRVEVTTIGDMTAGDKDRLNEKTILLPPCAGGLEKGLFDGSSNFEKERTDYDVADEWYGPDRQQLRARIWDEENVPNGMSIVETIDTNTTDNDADDSGGKRFWHRCAIDVEENKNSKSPVSWTSHVDDVVRHATAIVRHLSLDEKHKHAVVLAARFHDHGKRRAAFQRVLGNFQNAEPLLAKSGVKNRHNQLKEDYRHEFGSLIDLEEEEDFQKLTDDDMKDLVRHLIATHHGNGRPHFPNPYDSEHADTENVAREVPRRFARLQRKYGRWGLAYLESLLRAADWAASANPTMEDNLK